MNTRKATPGHWLTQANLDNESNRIFVHEVAGFGDLDAAYREATDEEKAAWEAEEHPTAEDIPAEEALDIITGRAEE